MSHQSSIVLRRWPSRAWMAALGVLLAAGSAARGADGQAVNIEINKLETHDKSCRAYFVVDNPGSAAFQSLRLDLVLFRTDGVIDRRLALDVAPIRPSKKSVKIFDLDGLPCDGIGSVLLNEVAECRDATGPVADCADKLKVSSRAGVPFSK